MSPLLELQDAFARELLRQFDAPARAGLFKGTESQIRKRLAIYRANLEGNYEAALEGAYPVVRKIVGEGYFALMARNFSRAHASRSGDLNHYGEAFAGFIAREAEIADVPYLPDVAKMEWCAHLAYYAADPTPFNFAELAEIPPERYSSLSPRLSPACAILTSDWPIGRIWAVHQDDHEEPFEVDLRSGPQSILVHRPHWRAYVETLSEGDFHFLLGASCGAALGIAIDAAIAADPEFNPSFALRKWIHAKVIDRVV